MLELLAEAILYLLLTWAPFTCGAIGLLVGAWLFGLIGAIVGMVTGVYCGILLWRQSRQRDEQAWREQEARQSPLSRANGRQRRGWWS